MIMERNNNKRIAVLTRISSKAQADNGSLARQESNCRQLAYKLGFDDSQIDVYGRKVESAGKKGGKEFVRLYKGLFDKAKNYHGLIVNEIDRLSRLTVQGSGLISEMESCGLHLYSVGEMINTSERFSDYSNAIERVIEAERENEKRARYAIDGNYHRVKSGKAIRTAPFGYSSPQKHVYQLNEDSMYVKMAFELYQEGFSLTQIAKILSEKGCDRARNRWGDVLNNAFYCGRIYHANYMDGEEYVMGTHPKIVSELTFEAVKAARKSKKKNRDRKIEERLPLKKVLTCKCCGSSMTGYVQKQKKSLPAYYICNNTKCRVQFSAKQAHEGLNHVIDNVVIDMPSEVIKEVLEELYYDFVSVDVELLKSKEEHLNTLKTRRENFVVSYMEMDKKLISPERFNKQVEEFDIEMESVLMEIDSLKPIGLTKFIAENTKYLNTLTSQYSQASLDVKQEILTVVFQEDLVYNKEEKKFDEILLSPLFRLAA